MTPKIIVEQKITAFVNRYAIYSTAKDGQKDHMIAFAQQKRFAFKEKIVFYADQNKGDAIFSLRAEKVLDVHGRYLVEDASGHMIGAFKKDFRRSLVRSTWDVLDSEGVSLFSVKEQSNFLAVLRRYGGFIPFIGDAIDLLIKLFRYHFVFQDTTGETVGSYRKTTLIRDHYLLSMDNLSYSKGDWRVFAAFAVGLDALQSR